MTISENGVRVLLLSRSPSETLTPSDAASPANLLTRTSSVTVSIGSSTAVMGIIRMGSSVTDAIVEPTVFTLP